MALAHDILTKRFAYDNPFVQHPLLLMSQSIAEMHYGIYYVKVTYHSPGINFIHEDFRNRWRKSIAYDMRILYQNQLTRQPEFNDLTQMSLYTMSSTI